jgi:hypothetical protein
VWSRRGGRGSRLRSSSTLAGLVKVAGSSCPHVCLLLSPVSACLRLRARLCRASPRSACMVTFSFLCLLQHGVVSWMGRNCDDLDTINPNFKGFQIINHLRNYFKQITPFCFASQGGEAEARASPGGVAKRGSASPLRVAKQKSVCRHCDWRRRRACFATVSGDAL